MDLTGRSLTTSTPETVTGVRAGPDAAVTLAAYHLGLDTRSVNALRSSRHRSSLPMFSEESKVITYSINEFFIKLTVVNVS